MAAFTGFVRKLETAIGLAEWTPSTKLGTEEGISKEAVEPTAASETLKVESSTKNAKFTVVKWTGLPTSFKKITALTIHVYAKTAAEGENTSFKVLNAAKENKLELKPLLKTTSAWFKAEMVKATAEALTEADIEALAVEAEELNTKKSIVYEVYLSGEYEEATTGHLKSLTTVLFAASGRAVGKAAIVGHAVVTLGGTPQLAGQAAVAGQTSVVLGSSANLGSVAGLAAATSVRFTPTGSLRGLSTIGHLAGSTGIVVGAKGSPAARGAVSGLSAIRFNQTAKVSALGAVAGTVAVKTGASGALGGRGGLAGVTPVRFAVAGAVTGSIEKLTAGFIVTTSRSPATIHIKSLPQAQTAVRNLSQADIEIVSA